MEKEEIVQLLQELPPIIARTEVGKLTGGSICPKTLANLDVEGGGPANRFKIGKKVVYSRDDFINWILDRINAGS